MEPPDNCHAALRLHPAVPHASRHAHHLFPPTPPPAAHQLARLLEVDNHVAGQGAVHVCGVRHHQHVRLRLARPQAVEVDGGVKGGHAHLEAGAGRMEAEALDRAPTMRTPSRRRR